MCEIVPFYVVNKKERPLRNSLKNIFKICLQSMCTVCLQVQCNEISYERSVSQPETIFNELLSSTVFFLMQDTRTYSGCQNYPAEFIFKLVRSNETLSLIPIVFSIENLISNQNPKRNGHNFSPKEDRLKIQKPVFFHFGKRWANFVTTCLER